MAQIGTLNTFLDGVDEVNAQPLQYNYTEVASKINNHIASNTNVHGVVAPAKIISENEAILTVNKYIPIGVLRYVWDNDIAYIRGLLDTGMYVEMNGQTVNKIGSLYHGKTLPNLAEAYVVGAGTDGGANMSAASIGYATVGSNSPLSHTHQLGNHIHNIEAHTHTISHSHEGNIGACIEQVSASTTFFRIKTISNSSQHFGLYRQLSTNIGAPPVVENIVVSKNKGIEAKNKTFNVYSEISTSSNGHTSTTSDFQNTGSINFMPIFVKKKCYLKVL